MIKLPSDGGAIQWSFETDTTTGKTIIKTEQNESPILELNNDKRNMGYKGNLSFGRHVASVPFILWNRWIKDNPPLKAGKHHPDYETTLYKLIMAHNKVKVNDDILGVR